MSKKPTLFLLCGGFGRRLGELTRDRPKALVEILGRPFLDWLLEDYRSRGVEDVVLLSGYASQQLLARYHDGAFGLRIRHAVDSGAGIGTARAAMEALRGIDGDVLLANGDTLVEFELEKLVETHKLHNRTVTMPFTRQAARGKTSIMTGSRGTVVAYTPNDGSGVIKPCGAGLYVVSPARLAALVPGGEDATAGKTWEEVVVDGLMKRGEVHACPIARAIDMGTPKGLHEMQIYLEARDLMG